MAAYNVVESGGLLPSVQLNSEQLPKPKKEQLTKERPKWN